MALFGRDVDIDEMTEADDDNAITIGMFPTCRIYHQCSLVCFHDLLKLLAG